jgi:signal transduction histidine kinase
MAMALTVGLACAQTTEKDAEMVAMVEKAAAMFKEKGKDYTVKLIGSLEGPFRKGELYVFCMTTKGLMLAHPVNKNLEGTDVSEFKDPTGKLYVKEFIKTATGPGSGWVDYLWQRHGEKEHSPKRAYVLKVPGEDILVAGGVYEKATPGTK